MQGIALQYRLMFTFDNIKRVIALIFVLVSAVSAQTQKLLEFDPNSVVSVCTESGIPINYPAGITGDNVFSSKIGCLSTTPSGKWFIMQIANGGDLKMKISHSDNKDVDFAAFGPFSGGSKDDVLIQIAKNPGLLVNTCSGTCNDCSYLPDYTETFTIENAQKGDWYLVLITNFSQKPGNISFEKVGGKATTNCDIVFEAASTGPYCIDEDIHLYVNSSVPDDAQFVWKNPKGSIISRSKTVDLKATGNKSLAGEYSVTMTTSVNGKKEEYVAKVNVVVNTAEESGIKLVEVIVTPRDLSTDHVNGELLVKFENENSSPLEFTLSAAKDGKSKPKQYSAEKEGDIVFSDLAAGNYKLAVNVENKGCKREFDVTISDTERPVIESVDIIDGKYVFNVSKGKNTQSVNLYEFDGVNYKLISEKNTNSTIYIDANKITNINFVASGNFKSGGVSNYSEKYTMKFPTDLYVKIGGKGNGRDWERAMGEFVFANVLQHLKDYNRELYTNR